MKSIYTLLLICFTTTYIQAQSTTGMVAHWGMDSSTNDISGNGHNGHANNITPAVGKDGVMGHGYYFNGSNSWISVPYSPAFNVTGYSICARVKVMGFYSGTCHANTILVRGKTGLGNCVYTLQFSDAPAGVDCSSGYDSTKENFWTGSSAPSATLSPASIAAYHYTPYITEGVWYDIVATFNDTTYKLYVNGVQKNTANIINPGLPMGAGTDSISIGYDLMEASAGYPYAFKGIIDDIRLYNRPLNDSEIAHYGDTCGSIITQPVAATVHIGGNAVYSLTTSIAAATYQWQQDAGTGYLNLANSGPFSGVFTPTLTVSGITAGLVGNHYRCLVANSWGCSDTSAQALLTTGIKEFDITGQVSVYPNPVADELYVNLHGVHNDASFQMFNQLGVLVLEGKFTANQYRCSISSLASGVYYIKATSPEGVGYKKVVKY